MRAIISNYHLMIDEFGKKPDGKVSSYRVEWDNWVTCEEDIQRLNRYLRTQIAAGEKPIVAVFEEERS